MKKIGLKDLTAYQQDVIHGKICPYCKSVPQLKPQNYVYGKKYNDRLLMVCKNWPTCDSYVGCDDNDFPLGRLAKWKLRLAKKDAHYHFDHLWRTDKMKRNQAYKELSNHLGLSKDLCHIGMMGLKSCENTKQWAIIKFQTFI